MQYWSSHSGLLQMAVLATLFGSYFMVFDAITIEFYYSLWCKHSSLIT